MEQGKEFTPEEIAKLTGERIESDADLLEGGAKMMPNEDGAPRLEPTGDQVEEIKRAKEMEDNKDLYLKDQELTEKERKAGYRNKSLLPRNVEVKTRVHKEKFTSFEYGYPYSDVFKDGKLRKGFTIHGNMFEDGSIGKKAPSQEEQIRKGHKRAVEKIVKSGPCPHCKEGRRMHLPELAYQEGDTDVSAYGCIDCGKVDYR